jgi:hypothetical protein
MHALLCRVNLILQIHIHRDIIFPNLPLAHVCPRKYSHRCFLLIAKFAVSPCVSTEVLLPPLSDLAGDK